LKRTILILVVTVCLAPATLAQSRKRSSSSRSKSSATKSKTSAAAETQRVAAARTAGATRVADQIKFLSKFIYLLGGAASNMAAVDESIKRNPNPELDKQNQQAKARVKGNVTGFREAMDKLEVDFRATPELQPYYIKLAGVAAGTATAEQQAGDNQFDAAGRSLLNVVNRLTDVLFAMRQ
jgi:hypothetical protein